RRAPSPQTLGRVRRLWNPRERGVFASSLPLELSQPPASPTPTRSTLVRCLDHQECASTARCEKSVAKPFPSSSWRSVPIALKTTGANRGQKTRAPRNLTNAPDSRRGKPESPGEGEPLFWGRLMFLLCSCGAWRCRTCQPLVHNSSEFSPCSRHDFGQFLEGFHRVDRDEAIFTTKIWTEVLEVHNLFIAKSGIRCQDASKTYNLSIGIEGTSSMVVVKGWQSLPQNQASASLMTRISALQSSA
ncbi:hypothetical protein CTAM01_15446, partial [Colletotrichum tamarilloi]